MAGALRKTMEYLGLAESDERYDDYDAYREEPVQREASVHPLHEDDPATAKGLLEGTLEVSRAFLLGRLRVEGDLGTALPPAAAHRPPASPGRRG